MADKAVRATIKLGDIDLDVFQLPDGSYGFSSTGIAELLGLSSDKRVREILTSKGLESKTGMALGFGKNVNFSLTFPKVSTEDSGNINFLKIDLLMLLVNYEAFKNDNLKAQAVLEASLEEALDRRADAAFNIIKSEEERNKYFAAKIKHQEVFHPYFTIWLKLDGLVDGKDYAREVNRLKTILNLPLISINNYTSDQLWILNKAETRYDSYRTAGLNHEQALEQVQKAKEKDDKQKADALVKKLLKEREKAAKQKLKLEQKQRLRLQKSA